MHGRRVGINNSLLSLTLSPWLSLSLSLSPAHSLSLSLSVSLSRSLSLSLSLSRLGAWLSGTEVHQHRGFLNAMLRVSQGARV